MLFNFACVLICGILMGIIAGFIICRPVIYKRMLEVETHWKDKINKVSDSWKDFHKAELEKWQEKTTALVNKTYYDTVEERDKAWELKFRGTKFKPKPPTN